MIAVCRCSAATHWNFEVTIVPFRFDFKGVDLTGLLGDIKKTGGPGDGSPQWVPRLELR